MKKNFTFVLPDEPYKTATTNNNVINATYDGPRFLVARVENATGIVQNVVRVADEEDQLDLSTFFEEGHTFFILDASKNAFEAAYLTTWYTHELIEDPTFELPNGLGSWTYHYDDFTGGINQCFYGQDLKYDLDTKEFIAPHYREHAVTRESVFSNAKILAADIEKALKINDYPEEDAQKLSDYKDWLLTLEETYEDVDHWKIPFPNDIPPL